MQRILRPATYAFAVLVCALTPTVGWALCANQTTCSACVVHPSEVDNLIVRASCQWCDNRCLPLLVDDEDQLRGATPLCYQRAQPDALYCTECQNLAPLAAPRWEGWYLGTACVGLGLVVLHIVVAVEAARNRLSRETCRNITYLVTVAANVYALAGLLRNSVVVWSNVVPSGAHFQSCTRTLNDLNATYPGQSGSTTPCNLAPGGDKVFWWIFPSGCYVICVTVALVTQYLLDCGFTDVGEGVTLERRRATAGAVATSSPSLGTRALMVLLGLVSLTAAPAVTLQHDVPLTDSCIAAQTLGSEIIIMYSYGGVVVVAFLVALTVFCTTCDGDTMIGFLNASIRGIFVCVAAGLAMIVAILATSPDTVFRAAQYASLSGFPTITQLVQGTVNVAVEAMNSEAVTALVTRATPIVGVVVDDVVLDCPRGDGDPGPSANIDNSLVELSPNPLLIPRPARRT